LFTFSQILSKDISSSITTPMSFSSFTLLISCPNKLYLLIKKIENYGITNPILSWIQDFLTRLNQQVSINGETSNRKEDISGIPQGSVLEPILFVIYINDLPEAEESEAYLFADDTKIFRVINMWHLIKGLLEVCINTVYI
jgi:hypothetical protein